MPLLEKGGFDLNEQDERGRTVLMEMVLSGLDNAYCRTTLRYRVTELLAFPHLRVDLQDQEGCTLADRLGHLLEWETLRGRHDMVAILQPILSMIEARQLQDGLDSGGSPSLVRRLRL